MTCRLGLAGGLGSGKTAFARALERRAVPVFYADAEAKRLMQEDAALRAALIEAFGPETYRVDGSLDRARLAARVFADPNELARLNALVHPVVFRAWERFAARAEADGRPLVAHESAILFESGGAAHVDAVAWIDAPRETRIARALARDAGATRASIEARLAHQIDPDEARQRAAYVIDNGGSLADLDAAAERLLDQLQ